MTRDTFTIHAPTINARAKEDSPFVMTKAAQSALYVIAEELDARRINPSTSSNEPVKITIPLKRLRGPYATKDNRYIYKILENLRCMRIVSAYDGEDWVTGAIAAYTNTKGATTTTIELLQKQVMLFRAGATFAKVEASIIYKLPPNARAMYLMLAERFRDVKEDSSIVLKNELYLEVSDLKKRLGFAANAYPRWNNFCSVVLKPSITCINERGALQVTMTIERNGNKAVGVLFRWSWKQPQEIGNAAAEANKHSAAQYKKQENSDAPPLTDEGRFAKRLEQSTRGFIDTYRRRNFNEDPTEEQIARHQERFTAEWNAAPTDGKEKVLLADLRRNLR